MSETILFLDEARQHTLSAGPKHLLRLTPGRNVVDTAVYEAVLAGGKNEKITQLKKMIDDGIVKVHGDELDITKMNAKDAIGIVGLETTIEGLEHLLTQEGGQKKPRVSVMDAIEEAIEKIEEANKAATNPDEE